MVKAFHALPRLPIVPSFTRIVLSKMSTRPSPICREFISVEGSDIYSRSRPDAILTYQAIDNKMSVGVLVYDAAGEVVAAMCSIVPFVNDLAVAEALALWRTISFYQALDIQRLHLEGDVLKIVQALIQS